MNEPGRTRGFWKRAAGWMLLLGLGAALYALYRWAEPKPGQMVPVRSSPASNVTMRLENAPFTGYANGNPAWSLWAGRIELERQPGAALSNIQNATLTDIRRGTLYRLPADALAAADAEALSARSASPASARANASSKHESSAPVATFHARQGRYTLGELDPLPPEMTLVYIIQSQFKLSGDVDFLTRAGEHLQADSLTILEMVHQTTRKTARRVLCNSGARITLKDVHVQANQARYDPASRSVECLGGVRGTFKNGTVQAERLFWSLGEQMLRCPESASGVLRGMPFTAEGLTIDLKRRVLRANHARVMIRIDEVEKGK